MRCWLFPGLDVPLRTIREDLDLEIFTNSVQLSLLDQWRVAGILQRYILIVLVAHYHGYLELSCGPSIVITVTAIIASMCSYYCETLQFVPLQLTGEKDQQFHSMLPFQLECLPNKKVTKNKQTNKQKNKSKQKTTLN